MCNWFVYLCCMAAVTLKDDPTLGAAIRNIQQSQGDVESSKMSGP